MVEKTEELLTVSEVARRLRVDETTVRRWIKMGSLEAPSPRMFAICAQSYTILW